MDSSQDWKESLLETLLHLLMKYFLRSETMLSIWVYSTIKKEWRLRQSFWDQPKTTENKTTWLYIMTSILLWTTLFSKLDMLMSTILESMVTMNVNLFLFLEYLRPYFRDPHNIKLYGLNSGIIFDSTSDEVYNKLKSEFMKS